MFTQPWVVASDNEEISQSYVGELRREVAEGHELYGMTSVIKAYCGECNTCVFEIGNEIFAVVELTMSGRGELPPLPHTEVVGGYIAIEMVTDQHEHSVEP